MIGENIRMLREKAGLTQDDVARHLGISPQAVYKYEKNIVTNIPISSITSLSKLFGVSPNEITGWQTETPAPAHSSEHDQLIAAYDQLNDAGKEAALSYLSYLGQQPIYKNDHQFGMGKKRSGSVT